MTDDELQESVYTIVRSKKLEGYWSSWSYEELFSEGYMQALKLREKHDPTKKTLFNYLWSWLPLRISDGLRSFHGWTRSCPDYKDQGLDKWHKKAIDVDKDYLDTLSYPVPVVKEEIPLDFLVQLTDKEQEILGLYLRGMTLKQIGYKFGMTESGMCHKMRTIYKKGNEYSI